VNIPIFFSFSLSGSGSGCFMVSVSETSLLVGLLLVFSIIAAFFVVVSLLFALLALLYPCKNKGTFSLLVLLVSLLLSLFLIGSTFSTS